MRAATLAAIVLAAVTAGCGQHSSERPAVARYVKQVNTIETSLARPLTAVTSAGNQFSAQQRAGERAIVGLFHLSPEQSLQKAWIQIGTIRTRLATLSTPTSAERLRSLLLRLIDAQAAMTHELAKLAGFLPRYSAALGSLAPATRQLEAVLSQKTAYGSAAVSAVFAGKVAALRRFQATTAGIASRLRRLDPPAVSRPGYRAQLAAVKGMSASAGQLASALATGAPNVGPLLTRFDRAAASSNTVAVQKAEIAAARTYDSRSTELEELSREVERERLRLSNTLK